MSQYRDEGQAVARAMNAGEGKPVPAKWQSQYTAGYRESTMGDADPLMGIDRLLADSLTHALIRRTVSAEQYLVLVLRYSGDERARLLALKSLLPVVGSNAGPQTRAVAVGAWAGYQQQLPAGTDYDGGSAAESTVRGYRMQIKRHLDGLHKAAFERLSDAMKSADLVGVD